METIFDALQLELTNKCQLDCAECPRRLMTRPIGDMDLGLARMLAEEALNVNPNVTFVVNGLGDPIVYPHLAEYIEFIHLLAGQRPHAHPTIHFFTNLSVPTPKLVDIFTVLQRIALPVLIATTRHMYDGKGKLAAPVSRFYDDNLRVAAEMVKGHPRMDLHAHMVITKFHTEQDIEKFFAHFRTILPNDKVHISRQLNPWFDLVTEMAGPEGPDPAAMRRPGSGVDTCHYPFKTCHIGWDGEMIICCTDDVNQDTHFGKVKEPGDLMRLWNGAELRLIRERFNRFFDGDFSSAPKACQRCYRLAWLKNSAPAMMN